jgi:hypothetical protein
MAHFAKLDENNAVIDVLVVSDNDLLVDGVETESKGVEFLAALTGHANWKQTSYNGKIRKNYASIGSTYDAQRDAFISPKVLASWVLNEDTCRWEYCVPYPKDGKQYEWSEIQCAWRELPPPRGATPVVTL